MIWLATPCVLFPLVAGPEGSAWYQWVCVFCCSQDESHGFVLDPVELPQDELWQGCETQATVYDAEYHTLIQQEQRISVWLSVRTVFFFTHEFCWFDLRFVREHVVELDREVSEAVRTFCDFSAEWDCCPTALLLRVPLRACSVLGLIRTVYLCTIMTLFPATPEQQWPWCRCHSLKLLLLKSTSPFV